MDRGPIFYGTGIFFLYAFTISRLAVDFLYHVYCILVYVYGRYLTNAVPIAYV
jgi:hypothetical protein